MFKSPGAHDNFPPKVLDQAYGPLASDTPTTPYNDFTQKVLDETVFAQALSAIPETAHLPTYNLAVIPTVRRHLGDTINVADLAHRSADPNTPLDTLIFLAGICPAEFSANPALPLLLLEDPALPTRFEPTSLGRLLSYPGVPADFLRVVAQLGQPEFAQAAHLHVTLDGEAGSTWRDEMAQALIHLPNIPKDDLLILLLVLGLVPGWLHERIAASHDPRLAAALAIAAGDHRHSVNLARMPALPSPVDDADDLVRLLNSNNPIERARAAADPRTPPHLLAETKTREDWGDCDPVVFAALACNPSTPTPVLLALANNKLALFSGVRRAVALNPAAPPDALDLLADEPYAIDIPLILAAHPNLSSQQHGRMAASALDRAWGSFDPFYRAIALAQADVTPEQLDASSRSPFWVERLAVALHPRTTLLLRAILHEDGNRLVRAAARSL